MPRDSLATPVTSCPVLMPVPVLVLVRRARARDPLEEHVRAPCPDKEPMLDHERLDVYQIAIEFLALVVEILEGLPRGQGIVADQLKRAALSIPLNIAEGCGKPTLPDRARFYAHARGSAMESAAILDALNVLGILQSPLHQRGKALLIRIVSMLSKMCR